MDINTIANEARQGISNYCIHECNAFCCTKGILILTHDELLATFGDNEADVKANEQFIVLQKDGRYALHLSRDGKGCPSLNEEHMCNIHTSSRRSKTCAEFPIFIKDNKVFISPRCFANADRKFYGFVYQAEALKYEIVIKNPFDE